MSMTIRQEPSTSDVHGVFEPLIYVLTSTEQADVLNYKFRYIADLYVSIGGVDTLVSRVRVYPNSEGAGVFRVDKLIQDWMSVTKADDVVVVGGNLRLQPIHALGISTTTKVWSRSNGENYRQVSINFGQEYATSLTEDATPIYDVLPDNTIDCIMSGGLRRPTTWDMGIPNFLSSESWVEDYIPNASRKQVFSDRQIDTNFTSTTAPTVSVVHQETTLYEVRTLGVGMDGSAPQLSEAVSAWVGLYSSADALLDSAFFTASTGGGVAPGSVISNTGRLQYIGVGPWNLKTQTIDSLSASFLAGTVAYYEVFFMKDSTTVPSDLTLASMASCCYKFTLKGGNCKFGTTNYNYVTLAWQNSFGSWDYQSFNLLHQRTTGSIDRTTFEQVAGPWDTASATQAFNYRGDQGGTRISNLTATQTMKANTDLFNEDEVALLETLYLSPNVFLLGQQGATITPVVITDSSFVRKNNLNEGGPFLYQISFKYAKERPTTKGGTYRA